MTLATALVAAVPAQASSKTVPASKDATQAELMRESDSTYLHTLSAAQLSTASKTSDEITDVMQALDDKCAMVSTSYVVIEGDPKTYILDDKTGKIVEQDPLVQGATCESPQGAAIPDQSIVVEGDATPPSISSTEDDQSIESASNESIGSFGFTPNKSRFVAQKIPVRVGAGVDFGQKGFPSFYNALFADNIASRATGPAAVKVDRWGGPNCSYFKGTQFPLGYNFHSSCPSNSVKGSYSVLGNATWPIGPRATQVVKWNFSYTLHLV